MWGATCTFTVTGTYQGGGNDTKLFARVAAGARGTTASRAAPKRTRRPSARRGEAQGARRRARRRSSTHCLSLATADRAAAQRIPGHLLLPSVGPRQNAAAPALLACWPACWMRPAACSRSDRAPSRIAPAACDHSMRSGTSILLFAAGPGLLVALLAGIVSPASVRHSVRAAARRSSRCRSFPR